MADSDEMRSSGACGSVRRKTDDFWSARVGQLARRRGRCSPPPAPRSCTNRVLEAWAEYTLYSDAPVSGELAIGPYAFLNTVAHWPGPAAIGTPTPMLVLRANMHLSEGGPDQMDLTKESVADYYGGDLDDELAALLALALGCRTLGRHHATGVQR